MRKPIIRVILGFSVLFIGVILLADNLFSGISFFNFSILWPIFLIIPGIFFLNGFVSNRKDWGLLIPGTLLVLLGLGFLTNMIISKYLGYDKIWSVTAFMYTASVSASFFAAWYFADSKDKDGLLIPACILLAVSGITFFNTALAGIRDIIKQIMSIVVPLLIIGIGAWLLLRNRNSP